MLFSFRFHRTVFRRTTAGLAWPVRWLIELLLAAASMVSANPPNVVFIISDDQNWTDYGFMGHPKIETPHLDRLASQSLVYERGYVSAPLCRPSLASMVTGLHPHQHNIRGNDPVLPGRVRRNDHPELFAEWRPKMSAPMQRLTSFIRVLKENGYLTLQTGKWWEGNPLDHGFTAAMTHGDTPRGGRHGDEGLRIGRETQQPYYDFVDQAVVFRLFSAHEVIALGILTDTLERLSGMGRENAV